MRSADISATKLFEVRSRLWDSFKSRPNTHADFRAKEVEIENALNAAGARRMDFATPIEIPGQPFVLTGVSWAWQPPEEYGVTFHVRQGGEDFEIYGCEAPNEVFAAAEQPIERITELHYAAGFKPDPTFKNVDLVEVAG